MLEISLVCVRWNNRMCECTISGEENLVTLDPMLQKLEGMGRKQIMGK